MTIPHGHCGKAEAVPFPNQQAIAIFIWRCRCPNRRLVVNLRGPAPRPRMQPPYGGAPGWGAPSPGPAYPVAPPPYGAPSQAPYGAPPTAGLWGAPAPYPAAPPAGAPAYPSMAAVGSTWPQGSAQPSLPPQQQQHPVGARHAVCQRSMACKGACVALDTVDRCPGDICPSFECVSPCIRLLSP